MNEQQYNQLKKSYQETRAYLLEKHEIYLLNKQIVSQGIVAPHMGIGEMDRIYKKVKAFVDMYETYMLLVKRLDDLGFKMVVRSVN